METEGTVQRFDPPHTHGLTDEEVSLRIGQGLANAAPDTIARSTWQIIRGNLFTLFNAFNFTIGACLFAIGAYANMVYLLPVLSNIAIGIGQEIYGRNMVKNLSLIGQLKVAVVRGGKEREVPVDQLVLDDITVLAAGNQVCADSIVADGSVEVNESLLTGEADPVYKAGGDSLLSGSFVISGKCKAKVERVGADNYAAKLAQEAKQYKQANSELLRSMRKVTRFTSYFIVPIAALLFLEAYLIRSDTVGNSIIATSAALLGMLPKGLVLLISASLIVGITLLSRKKILVQELYALETLAHVDMLCLDKTGTLTEGKMSVSDIVPLDGHEMPIPIERAIGCFIGALEDNNATFLALKERFAADDTRRPIAKTPFSSERKWSCVTFEDIGAIAMGAPEQLVQDGGFTLPDAVSDVQASGKRVLCLGYSAEPPEEGTLNGIKPVAAIVFSDPLRKGAKKTLDFFKREGVNIRLISGDSPLTVSNVARRAGFENYEAYVDMTGMDSEADIEAAAARHAIFGRVSPNQKKLLVQAFQKNGHTVAMTGDGVNDVLALREADCSIAMSAGSDAARQVSQLVLLNSDFTALPDAVMEGRRVINNITRFGSVFMVKTIFSILLSLFAIVTMTPFPFLPIQITLYDLFIEGYASFILQFEPNPKRIRGTFLPTVIRNASPMAILILLNTIAVTCLAPLLGLSGTAALTVIFYTTGFAGILAVLKACRPFNILRLLIFSTVVPGFYAAAYLFRGTLGLEALTTVSYALFAISAVLAVPIVLLLAYGIRRHAEKARRTPRQGV